MLLLILLLFTNNAFAKMPDHCSPWPPDGFRYVNTVKYDHPIPSPCYSIMINGVPFDPELMKLNSTGDGLEPDPIKVKAKKDKEDADETIAKDKINALKAILIKAESGGNLTKDELNLVIMTILKSNGI